MNGLYHLFLQDLRIAYRNRSEWLNPLIFLLIVIALFPIAIGPEPAILKKLAPAIFWIAALLSTTLSLNRLFQQDFEDGSLEQWLLSPCHMAGVALAKVAAHWCISHAAMIVITPILAVLLHLPLSVLPVLWGSLFIGTLNLSLIGAIGMSLVVGLKRPGVLVALLVLPLCVPVLIFGINAVVSEMNGESSTSHLAFLGAILLLSLITAPFFIQLALKINSEAA